MKIYITRHGQTKLNKARLMQGRTDEPLNEHGIKQAEEARKLLGEVHFDRIYSSPLKRAITTASIIGDIDASDIITDDRIIEADFGPYEMKPYAGVGPEMALYWMAPWIFKAPSGVETLDSMRSRAKDFLDDVMRNSSENDNILISCHGGIIRSLCGYLENAKNGVCWYPKPKNCEIRIYEVNGSSIKKTGDIVQSKNS